MLTDPRVMLTEGKHLGVPCRAVPCAEKRRSSARHDGDDGDQEPRSARAGGTD